MSNDVEKNVQEKENHEDGLIHLFIDEKNLGDSVVPVRWCICKSVFDKLKEQSAKSPHILLVVAKYRSKTKDSCCYEKLRKIIPIEEMMGYIQFQGTGRHKILATIIWRIDGDAKRLRKNFFEKNSDGEYMAHVLNEQLGKLYTYLHSFDSSFGQGEIEVEVSQEFFAKEPPKWLKAWVNMAYDSSPVDQCHFRRRLLLSPFANLCPIFILLIYFIFGILIYGLLIKGAPTLVFLLCGMRNIKFRAIIDTDYSLRDVLDRVTTSVFLYDKNRKFRSILLIPFIPIVPVSLFLFLGIISFFTSTSLLTALITTFKVVICLFVFLLAINILSVLSSKGFKSQTFVEIQKTLENRRIKAIKRREAKLKAVLEEAYKKKIMPLVCLGVPLKADLSALPSKNQTVYLRFLDLKRKVCKPFAKY